jgi:hypothetical protein
MDGLMVEDDKTEDSDDILRRGKEAFSRCDDAEEENRARALEDIRFARLGEQWPEAIEKQRRLEQRPCLTINKMPAFIRQVVNDARQNKPQIKVHPVDSNGDPKTAKVIDGLIRNIEYTSNADVAYDTAIEASVSGGFGYWRIGMDYAFDDTFDMDLTIERVANQFSVYGDPDSMAADSSDWNVAFVIDRVSRADYKSKYGKRENKDGAACDVDFDSDAWTKAEKWLDDDNVLLAEWWQREEVEKTIYKLSDGQTVEEISEESQAMIEQGSLQVVGKRVTKSHKVTQTILSGADVLSVREWPGKYIPIVPVYGDEVVVEGKRYFISLIHNALDAQRMVNYWRSTATELVALAPRVPFIGRTGTFDSDADRWATANTKSHSYLEYDKEPPIRLPLDSGVAAGALQEALNASDDMKAIIGLYDASLGARSNETSGVAINARQREGDVATFHFIDNLTRAIRHTGRILIDLIPKVYTNERVIRVVGEDGTQETQPVNQPVPEMDEEGKPLQQPRIGPDGQPVMGADGNPVMDGIMGMRDLTAGKYDLTVTSGPSFTTRREEAAMQITEVIRAFPQGAAVLAPLLAKNSDWPGADEIERELKKLTEGNVPPELQKQIEQGKQELERLTAENQQLKMDQSAEQAKLQAQTQAKMAEIAAKAQADKAAADQEYALEIRKQDQQYQLKMREIELTAQIKTKQQEDSAEIAAYSAKHKAAQQESPRQG